MNLLVLISAFFISVNIGEAYFVTVDAHSEECFHERVPINSKLALTFEVAQGGFLDIDVLVSGSYASYS